MVSITIDDHILLRSFEVADAQELFDAVNESRKHLNPWLDWVAKTIKPEQSLHFIQQSLQKAHTQEGLDLALVYDGKIIGGIGMHHWDHATRKAEIGYWISAAYEGKGIVRKCLSGFTSFLFEKIGLNKIEIHFVQANTRSAHIAARLGFKIEGVIRQSVMRNGMPEDVIIAGLLKGEKTPGP